MKQPDLYQPVKELPELKRIVATTIIPKKPAAEINISWEFTFGFSYSLPMFVYHVTSFSEN